MKPPDQKTGVKRSPSETTTLVCAVSLAVALGVACGAWINSRLASAASTPSAAVNRLRPVERAAVQQAPEPTAAAEPAPAEHHDAHTATGDAPPSVESPEAGRPGADDSGVAADKVSEPRRAGPAPLEAEERPRAKAPGARGGAAEVEERRGGAREVAKRATAGQGRVAPCALYASASALTVRGGGAATLILGGPGEAGRVTVTTPNWSDIAVFSEGRVGDKGWVRYSVRSISKRAGVYAVRFATPCGSHNIPVTVTRP